MADRTEIGGFSAVMLWPGTSLSGQAQGDQGTLAGRRRLPIGDEPGDSAAAKVPAFLPALTSL
jgi:hypothetical protein